jgi:hypothetical protein
MMWPDYGSPGAPNLDPYYLSPRQVAEFNAQERAQAEMDALEAEAERQAAEEDAALCAFHAEKDAAEAEMRAEVRR